MHSKYILVWIFHSLTSLESYPKGFHTTNSPPATISGRLSNSLVPFCLKDGRQTILLGRILIYPSENRETSLYMPSRALTNLDSIYSIIYSYYRDSNCGRTQSKSQCDFPRKLTSMLWFCYYLD